MESWVVLAGRSLRDSACDRNGVWSQEGPHWLVFNFVCVTCILWLVWGGPQLKTSSIIMAWVVLTFNLLVSVWIHVVITWQLRCGAKLILDGDLVDALTYPCDTTDPTIENPRFVKALITRIDSRVRLRVHWMSYVYGMQWWLMMKSRNFSS